MNDARARGQAAEAQARAFLERRGLAWVEGNYHCRGGVFVEVRYRRGVRFGGARASIDRRKQARLLHAAAHYLQRRAVRAPARIDVVALDGDGRIEWIQNAIQR